MCVLYYYWFIYIQLNLFGIIKFVFILCVVIEESLNVFYDMVV